MANMWMVRAAGGSLIDQFLEKGVVCIGFGVDYDLSECATKDQIRIKMRQRASEHGVPFKASGASNVSRFILGISEGDDVVTYDPAARIYHVGTVQSSYRFEPGLVENMPSVRNVKWNAQSARDALTAEAKNSLGSLLTVFQLSDDIAFQLTTVTSEHSSTGSLPSNLDDIVLTSDEELVLLEDVTEQAKEFVKDIVLSLDWKQMEVLVAGILRAMGYKTRLTTRGSDLGRDIIASPDGLGFEQPRIIVEVKHRKGQTGAPALRSFIAGLQASDRGLFVSTGGFSKEARYEASRGTSSVTLLDSDELATLLTEHYASTDTDTRALVPLTPIYWPVR